MATPRKQQIRLEQTPYYHCISRCVRRAFLCGVDKLTGRSFEHRRRLIETYLHHLASVFAIDVAAYAIMSNHHHVVLRVDAERAARWTSAEICERWGRLFKLPEPVQRFIAGELTDSPEREAAEVRITEYRERLASISWFMKCLNTDIARAANREDHCTGRFFEGRFKCQALLDEAALLTCIAYVDLNSVRAGMARTAEAATHTSLAHRVKARRNVLLPFATRARPAEPPTERKPTPAAATLPFRFEDYRTLVRWTAENIRPNRITNPPSLLRSLNLDTGAWQKVMKPGTLERTRALGAPQRIRAFAAAIGQAWMWGAATAGN
jgi:hypothetical protein